MPIQEPSVRECAGVYGDANSVNREWVVVREHDQILNISISISHTYVSPSEARKLARQLNRLAKRIEDRQ
jgi:hypothetical protein